MRSSFSAWWKELALAAFLGLFLLMHTKDGTLFVGFEGLYGLMCWWMGHSHRVLPLHGKVDRMTDMVGEVVEEMRGGRGEEETVRPALRLVHRD